MYYFNGNYTNNENCSSCSGNKKKALPFCGGNAWDSSRLDTTPGPVPDQWKRATCAITISKMLLVKEFLTNFLKTDFFLFKDGFLLLFYGYITKI